jgi:hypothetical protein
MASNTLRAAGHDHPWLQSTTLVAQDCARKMPRHGALAAKTRYR